MLSSDFMRNSEVSWQQTGDRNLSLCLCVCLFLYICGVLRAVVMSDGMEVRCVQECGQRYILKAVDLIAHSARCNCSDLCSWYRDEAPSCFTAAPPAHTCRLFQRLAWTPFSRRFIQLELGQIKQCHFNEWFVCFLSSQWDRETARGRLSVSELCFLWILNLVTSPLMNLTVPKH